MHADIGEPGAVASRVGEADGIFPVGVGLPARRDLFFAYQAEIEVAAVAVVAFVLAAVASGDNRAVEIQAVLLRSRQRQGEGAARQQGQQGEQHAHRKITRIAFYHDGTVPVRGKPVCLPPWRSLSVRFAFKVTDDPLSDRRGNFILEGGGAEQPFFLRVGDERGFHQDGRNIRGL